MFSQPKVLTLCFLFFSACDDKEDFNVPGNSNPQNGNNDDNLNDIDCSTSWEQVNDVWIDPNLCVAWSSKSSEVNWEESVEYCNALSEGALENWSVPSLEDLEDMSLRNPPFTDLEGDLWTMDEDPNSGLIWTVNLNQPGMTILLGEDSTAYVRCISK